MNQNIKTGISLNELYPKSLNLEYFPHIINTNYCCIVPTFVHNEFVSIALVTIMNLKEDIYIYIYI